MLKGTVHLAIASLDCKSIPWQQLSSLIAVWNGQPKSNKRNKRKKEGTKAITELGEAPLSLILPQAEGSGDCWWNNNHPHKKLQLTQNSKSGVWNIYL